MFGILVAFALYEILLFTATAVLPSGAGAFALPVVGRIFGINLVALAGLLVLHRLAIAIGLLATAPMGDLSAQRA
jgi:hypothetical protein